MLKSLPSLPGEPKAPKTSRAGSSTAGPPHSCAAAFAEETRRLFVDVVQRSLIDAHLGPAPRPVFRKVHGVARGRLTLDADIPERFRHGLFAERELVAWVRFSSDTAPDRPDSENATLGIGIKLFGVHGATLDEDDPDSGTADLLLQNHDRFFVDDGPSFCAFSEAAVFGDFDAYLAANPETKVVLDEMAKPETSVLNATYWSVLPYACGPSQAVKYRLQPVENITPVSSASAGPDGLASDLRSRLRLGPASFELALQAFVDEQQSPIDHAFHRWTTRFERVGILDLHSQDLNLEGQAAYGDNLSIHPWRTPEANRPLGSIAEARRVTYRSAARQRRRVNGIADTEPRRPR